MAHFGFNTAWLAAALDEPDRLVEALGLEVGRDTGDVDGEVLVAGPFDGWVLCAGDCLLPHADTAHELTPSPRGCAESERDACIRCRMSCGDQCPIRPAIATCMADLWGCDESQ